jgi:hypothetical protein
MKYNILTLAFWTIVTTSFSQALSNDTIHWTEYKILKWEDFKGESIEIPGMTGQAMMSMLASFKKVTLFLPTEASVVTVFDRKNSWTTREAQTEESLKYYQITFDLYEVYTRKLRKEFKHTKFGLDPNKVFQEKYKAVLTDLSDRNKLFMKETKMGQDTEAVDRWTKVIKLELKELDAFRQTK